MTSPNIVRHTFNALGLINAVRYRYSSEHLARKSFVREIATGRILNPKFKIGSYRAHVLHPVAKNMTGARKMGFAAAAYLSAGRCTSGFAPIAKHGAVTALESGLLARADVSLGSRKLGYEAVALGLRLVLLPYRIFIETLYIALTLTGACMGLLSESAAQTNFYIRILVANPSKPLQSVRTADALAMQEKGLMHHAFMDPHFFVKAERIFGCEQYRIRSYLHQTQTHGSSKYWSSDAAAKTRQTINRLFDLYPSVDQTKAISSLLQNYKVHVERRAPFLQRSHASSKTIEWAINRLIGHALFKGIGGKQQLWDPIPHDQLFERFDGQIIKTTAVYATVWHAIEKMQPDDDLPDEQKRQVRLNHQEAFFIALANKVDLYGNIEAMSEVGGIVSSVEGCLPVPKFPYDDTPLSLTQWAAEAYEQLRLPAQATPMLIRVRFENAYRRGLNLWPKSHHEALVAELATLARSKHNVEWIAGDL